MNWPAGGLAAVAEPAAGPAPLAERIGTVTERAAAVAEVAARTADEVDRDARFPADTFAALRQARLLGVAVPSELGGEDAGLAEVAEAVRILARACASSGMIYAMHQIQVWCLLRHGATPALRSALGRVATGQALLASATTEAKVGGDVRTSICALERDGERFRLAKQAPVISYGQQADAVLVTARRSPDSPPSDQVIVYCPAGPDLTLAQVSGWDTMGFRATCSSGFELRAEGPVEHVLPAPYGDISSQTMLPVSHILWASVWLGLAESAAERAHSYVRAQARQKPGQVPAAAGRLAELAADLQAFRALRGNALDSYLAHAADPESLTGIGFAVAMNGVKISASERVVDIVSGAMRICGMAGYRLDSPHSLGRHLRDAYGAALMVNNDRIVANSSQLLLASKEI